ncbi:hypothetical protein Tco_1229217 [Tanacetum coccineum]
MVNFTINLHHDGCFVTNSLHYLEGDHRVVEDIDLKVLYNRVCHNHLVKLVIIALEVISMLKPESTIIDRIDDPEEEVIDSQYKAKKEVQYPAFDPETPWDQCKPFLGMRFETPAQLNLS